MMLGRYCSSPSYVDDFKGRKATLNTSAEWKSLMKEFVLNTIPYLEQYHLRSSQGSGFSADKKVLG